MCEKRPLKVTREKGRWQKSVCGGGMRTRACVCQYGLGGVGQFSAYTQRDGWPSALERCIVLEKVGREQQLR